MRKDQLLLTLTAATISVASCGLSEDSNSDNKSKPNILFLLADDLGYGELGCYGQEIIRTPFIDSLSTQGMRFTDFYAGTSVCSPSRAVLMTGKHAGYATIRGNHGIFEGDVWRRVPLKKDEITLGDMLRQGGYQNGFIGKWHLEDPNDIETWAMNRGFDYVVQEQWGDEYSIRKFDEAVHWRNGWDDSIRYDPQSYDCIDVFRTNLAMEFLDQREKEKPFFLFMSYRIPHAHERYIRNKEMYSDRGWPDVERRHAARITMLDGQIKRLMERLEKDGELDNTIVIFTSDNGGHHELGHDHEFFKSNGDLRGHKRDMYEGGIRVPLIVYWRNKVKPGSISSHKGAFYDFMPTLAEIAGTDAPDITDGISIVPELLGKNQKQHKYLYWELQEKTFNRDFPDKQFRQGVRLGKWKGVRYGINGSTELYNLENDIFEKNNIADQHPEIVKEINRLFVEARTSTEHYPYGGPYAK